MFYVSLPIIVVTLRSPILSPSILQFGHFLSILINELPRFIYNYPILSSFYWSPLSIGFNSIYKPVYINTHFSGDKYSLKSIQVVNTINLLRLRIQDNKQSIRISDIIWEVASQQTFYTKGRQPDAKFVYVTKFKVTNLRRGFYHWFNFTIHSH